MPAADQSSRPAAKQGAVCPLCCITIAPYDPSRTKWDGQDAHGDCVRTQNARFQRLFFAAGLATACTDF